MAFSKSINDVQVIRRVRRGQRGPEAFVPALNSKITVELPGERTRAEVVKIVDPDALIVRLDTFLTSRMHTYRKGDLIAVRRQKSEMNQPIWRAIEEARPAPALSEAG